MSDANNLPDDCLILIGKTTYQATAVRSEVHGGYFWQLVALRGSKQPKSLFSSARGDWTLWSCHAGQRNVGLPKLVTPVFLIDPEAAV